MKALIEELRILKESDFWHYLSNSTRKKALTLMQCFAGKDNYRRKVADNRVQEKLKKENIMTIPIVLKDGKECNVSKYELQLLIESQKVLFFERSDGWAVIGRDAMRDHKAPLTDTDRREHAAFVII